MTQRRSHHWSLIVALVLLLGTLLQAAAAPQASQQPTHTWNPDIGGPLPLQGGRVHAIIRSTNGDLYVGGSFSRIGGIEAKNIARWDGQTWSALGQGVEGIVFEMVLSGTDVLVGGEFYRAGEHMTSGVARWDGDSWSTLGEGINTQVSAMTFYNGQLYVGGYPITLARWDGVEWIVPEERPGTVVTALLPVGNTLYVGGLLSSVGDLPLQGLAAWNGSTWSAVTGAPFDRVSRLLSHEGKLIVAGAPELIDTTFTSRVASWDGSTWTQLGTAVEGEINTLASHNGTLLMGRTLWAEDTSEAGPLLYQWNQTAWVPLNSATFTLEQHYGSVNEVLSDGTSLYVGGAFQAISGTPASGLAQLNNATWSEVSGVWKPGQLHAIAAASDGTIYVGGTFSAIGGLRTNNIAAWDGSAWSGLDGGTSSSVTSLAVDGADRLYALGGFRQAGGAPAQRVARWDGAAWQDLSAGIDIIGSSPEIIAARGNHVYLAGDIRRTGNLTLHPVVQLTNDGWTTVGTPNIQKIHNMAIDSQGRLYGVGLLYVDNGASIEGVVRWNGSTWATLLNTQIGTFSHHAITIDGTDRVIVAGYFKDQPWSTTALKRWDGTQWSTLAGTIHGTFESITALGEKIYTAGVYFMTTPEIEPRLGVWDGATWSAWGDITGTRSLYEPIVLTTYGQQLYAAGDFTHAGGHLSDTFAEWGPREAPEQNATSTFLPFLIH